MEILMLTEAKYAQARLRRARKDHRCTAPKKWGDGSVSIRWNKAPVPPDHHDIRRGEQYVEELGEALPFESGDRYCGPCAIAAGLATAVRERVGKIDHRHSREYVDTELSRILSRRG